MGRNNNHALGGSGVRLEVAPNFTGIINQNREIVRNWYQIFIDNIHLLNLKPLKWDKSSRLPIKDDIVLFTWTDSGYSKDHRTWKLGRVIESTDRKVTISYAGKNDRLVDTDLKTLERNPRDVSIIFSVDDFLINTSEHFRHACAQ